MIKRFKHLLAVSLLLIVIVAIALPVLAANLSCSWLDSSVAVSYEKTGNAFSSGSWSVSNATISGTASGGGTFIKYTGQQTLTFTFTKAGPLPMPMVVK